jgi:hypothetical protein
VPVALGDVFPMISIYKNGLSLVVGLMALLAVQPVPAQDQNLYLVSRTDQKSGQTRFGFIDKNGRLVIDYQRLPKAVKLVGEFH